jgi:hypothetical protein
MFELRRSHGAGFVRVLVPRFGVFIHGNPVVRFLILKGCFKEQFLDLAREQCIAAFSLNQKVRQLADVEISWLAISNRNFRTTGTVISASYLLGGRPLLPERPLAGGLSWMELFISSV